MRNLLAAPEERVFFKDRKSLFVLVSAGVLAALGGGRSLDELIGKTDCDLFRSLHARAFTIAPTRRSSASFSANTATLARVSYSHGHSSPEAMDELLELDSTVASASDLGALAQMADARRSTAVAASAGHGAR